VWEYAKKRPGGRFFLQFISCDIAKSKASEQMPFGAPDAANGNKKS
jgi:hypothetical protein